MREVEVLIRIPEVWIEAFKAFKHPSALHVRVLQGTALPKGHGELIDRQKLLSETYTMVEEDSLREYDILFSSDVENAPTVIEADREVDHADSN